MARILIGLMVSVFAAASLAASPVYFSGSIVAPACPAYVSLQRITPKSRAQLCVPNETFMVKLYQALPHKKVVDTALNVMTVTYY